jgi:hypothetical protein
MKNTLLAIVLATIALAQDQSLVVSGPLTDVGAQCTPADKNGKSPALQGCIPWQVDLDVYDAPALINAALGPNTVSIPVRPGETAPDAGTAKPSTATQDRYFIIHTVQIEEKSSSVKKQNWYVYHAGWESSSFYLLDPRLAKHYKELRIFGSANVSMVYMYIVKAGTQNDFDSAIKGLTDQSVQAAIQGYRDYFFLDKGAEPTALDFVDSNSQLLKHYSALALNKDLAVELNTLAYQIDITKKQPAPLKNLMDIAGLALGGMGANPTVTIQTQWHILAAGEAFTVQKLPSDIAITANSQVTDASGSSKQVEIGKNTFDDEKKYWYDFSLGLPLSSYNNLKYDSSAVANGTYQITPRTVNQKNLYAFFDAGLPRDTKALQYQIIPTVLYGLPIAGQPLKHHIFALSFGVNWANFFIGDRLDEKSFYADFNQPLIGSNVSQKWRTHLAYGVNFPVSMIVNMLKKPATSSK